MDDGHRQTLLALIALATENSPSSCFDDRRAMAVLRRETSPDELRELGVDDQLIDFVFAEDHDR